MKLMKRMLAFAILLAAAFILTGSLGKKKISGTNVSGSDSKSV